MHMMRCRGTPSQWSQISASGGRLNQTTPNKKKSAVEVAYWYFGIGTS